MEISDKIRRLFLETLKKSQQEMLEWGSFAIYNPEQNKIVEAISPEELLKYHPVKRERKRLFFHKELIRSIRKFNSGEDPNIKIANQLYEDNNFKIIGYHTHPHLEDQIVASKEDSRVIKESGAPLEIVISSKAQRLLSQDTPFVTCYTKEMLPSGEAIDFEKDFQHKDYEKIAQKLNLNPELLGELFFCEDYTKLIPSINYIITP